MVKKTTKVPDAWEDDDWETQADKAATEGSRDEPEQPAAPLTKAERLAQHAELNRKLWESAESPQPAFHQYLPPSTVTGGPASSFTAPPPATLTTAFKPAVTVLSRRPAQKKSAEEEEDEEEEARRKAALQLSPEEIRAKQQREREEKQRRYDEARAKIFGTPSRPDSNLGANPGQSSGASTPSRSSTPPRGGDGGGASLAGSGGGGRGRGGGGRGRGRGSGAGHHRNNDSRGEGGQAHSPRPSSQSSGGRELYDPNYSPKPGYQLERRGGGASLSGRSTPREEDQVLRAPRGPDGSGRGFGFAKRGTRGS
ncbi:hypothetical protein DL770_001084 [Monosporascus sp. CRB-9-2]|nr:hypothetical protein DL770_001084 [Monosporascus sp. CRB-9-2]